MQSGGPDGLFAMQERCSLTVMCSFDHRPHPTVFRMSARDAHKKLSEFDLLQSLTFLSHPVDTLPPSHLPPHARSPSFLPTHPLPPFPPRLWHCPPPTLTDGHLGRHEDPPRLLAGDPPIPVGVHAHKHGGEALRVRRGHARPRLRVPGHNQIPRTARRCCLGSRSRCTYTRRTCTSRTRHPCSRPSSSGSSSSSRSSSSGSRG